MNWTENKAAVTSVDIIDIDHPVGRAGTTESVLIVAIIWGIAILLV